MSGASHIGTEMDCCDRPKLEHILTLAKEAKDAETAKLGRAGSQKEAEG